MLSPMNAPDAVALRDDAEHVEPGDQPPEHRVDAVEVRLRRVRDEELAAARVRPGKGHPHGTHVVTDGIHLVSQHETGPAPTVAPGITVLHDEVGHDAVPAGSVKVAPVDRKSTRLHYSHRTLEYEILCFN